eukprot:11244-Heterococcus_DN1.PRE.1
MASLRSCKHYLCCADVLKYTHRPEAWVAYNDAEVDMFIYGLSPAAAKQKILALFSKIKSTAGNIRAPCYAVRTPHTIT